MSGIYVHIPFCKKQCSYCDFHFSTTFESYRTRMVDAILKEIFIRSKKTNELVETIYFGGGTPSILSVSELDLILNKIRDSFQLAENLEITLECNPDDCSIPKLNEWKKTGINRLSIGIQSFDQNQLEWMNRAHNAEESLAAVMNAVNCGFNNISIDLIYGLPDLTNDDWIATIEKVANLPISHISAYCLTIEEKTPLAAWVKSGKIKPVANEKQGEQFLLLVENLKRFGFEQYEISNFARENTYSKHNTSYWLNKSYVGIGPSAHGFTGDKRYWNIANNQLYMKQLEQNSLPEESEVLSANDKFNERLMVGLRTIWGVSINELKSYVTPNEEWFQLINKFENDGLLVVNNGQLILTKEGRLRADGIASDLFILD